MEAERRVATSIVTPIGPYILHGDMMGADGRPRMEMEVGNDEKNRRFRKAKKRRRK